MRLAPVVFCDEPGCRCGQACNRYRCDGCATPAGLHRCHKRNKHIGALGPSSSVTVPGGAKVLDGAGKFLIPGLADMHVHLTGAGEPTGSREFFLPLLVANGVTTVRDMGGNVERGELDALLAKAERFASSH